VKELKPLIVNINSLNVLLEAQILLDGAGHVDGQVLDYLREARLDCCARGAEVQRWVIE